MPHEPDSPSTNATLIARLRSAEDRAAWRAFVDLYTPLVYRYCQARGLQDADAQDVTQDVFTQVSRAMRTFQYDPARGRFRAWLGTLVHHAIARHRRKLDPSGRGLGGDDDVLLISAQGECDPAWVEQFNTLVLEAALDRARPYFDALTWRAFELTWLANQPARDAAHELDKPVPWIYKARFKVLEQLKEQVMFLTADIAFFARE